MAFRRKGGSGIVGAPITQNKKETEQENSILQESGWLLDRKVVVEWLVPQCLKIRKRLNKTTQYYTKGGQFTT